MCKQNMGPKVFKIIRVKIRSCEIGGEKNFEINIAPLPPLIFHRTLAFFLHPQCFAKAHLTAFVLVLLKGGNKGQRVRYQSWSGKMAHNSIGTESEMD
jgi:hypothetical protein